MPRRLHSTSQPLAENINIKLRKQGGLAIEGTVRDEAGKPVPRRSSWLIGLICCSTSTRPTRTTRGITESKDLGDGEFLIHVDAVHLGLVRDAQSRHPG